MAVHTCGDCKFARPIREDLTLIECGGVPPTPIAIPVPQGIRINLMRSRLKRTEPACALHKAVVLIEVPVGAA